MIQIIHTATGQPFELPTDMTVEMERTNPFFNDYGEMSLPIDLPASPVNRKLTGYPDLLSVSGKMPDDIECLFQSGALCYTARMCVLSADDSIITVTLLVNEGSFNARIRDVHLHDVFGDQTVEGVQTVAEALAFCRNLFQESNPTYTIFPVLVNSGLTWSSDGSTHLNMMNAYGYFLESGEFVPGTRNDLVSDFYYAQLRSEQRGDTEVQLPVGFYIAPFFRLTALLERIFAHFGYSFTDTPLHEGTFARLAVVHTCVDAIVSGSIRLADLLPDCLVTTLLDAVRLKFGLEFVSDEARRKITVVFLRDILSGNVPSADITPYLASSVRISAPENYCQIRLGPESAVFDAFGHYGVESIQELNSSRPDSSYSAIDCHINSTGYQYTTVIPFEGYADPALTRTIEHRANAASPYYLGGSPEVFDVTSPDRGLDMNYWRWRNEPGNRTELRQMLYAGDAVYRVTTLTDSATVSSSTEGDTAGNNEDESTMPPMFAFSIPVSGTFAPPYNEGCISNYVRIRTGTSSWQESRIADFTLAPIGPEGLFETFYRSYDDILRNSMHEVECECLLPITVLTSLQAYGTVLLNGQRLILNRITYDSSRPVVLATLSLYTIRNYSPVTTAPEWKDLLPGTGHTQDYRWEFRSSRMEISQEDYDHSPYRGVRFDTFYLPLPGPEYVGKRYHQRKLALENTPENQGLYDLWMECVPTT